MHPLMYSNNASINILRVLTMHPLMDSTFQDLSPATVCPFDVAGDRCWDSAQHLRTPYMPLLPPKPLQTSTTSEPLTYLCYLQALLILLLPPWESAQHLQNPYILPLKPLHTSATSEPLTYLFCLQDLSILLLLPKSCYTTYTYTYKYTYIYI